MPIPEETAKDLPKPVVDANAAAVAGAQAALKAINYKPADIPILTTPVTIARWPSLTPKKAADEKEEAASAPPTTMAGPAAATRTTTSCPPRRSSSEWGGRGDDDGRRT